MATTVSRSRRAEIKRLAARIRRDQQRTGNSTGQISTAIRAELPEVGPLEAWRLALGWSRAEAIEQVAAVYEADGLRPPALSESMLCRWEHEHDRPGSDYTAVIARAYGTQPAILGLTPPRIAIHAPCQAAVRYGRPDRPHPPFTWGLVPPMTTAAGLPAVRESVQLALLADPAAVTDAAQAAAEHYALNYSKHPPHILFGEVRAVRELVTGHLPGVHDATAATDLRRSIGWLSALLGNLAYHVADHSGAHVHLTAATGIGTATGDARLTAWSLGAQAMTARARGRLDAAVAYAERAVPLAPTELTRAQLLGWALLPALAQQGRTRDADHALAAADDALAAADGPQPGRWGYDEAEHRLHQAEAHLALGRRPQAAALAEASAGRCAHGTPGWAAATLLHAQAEAGDDPTGAAARALHVLDTVPPSRLRATARTRLTALESAVRHVTAPGPRDLHERLRQLPAPIDPHGRPVSDPA
jgi:tetratricopeptide (TPR) repeat protein